MSASEDRYRLTLELWAAQYVPEGAKVIDVSIVQDPGYKYSSYTYEDPHVDIDILYVTEEDGPLLAESITTENLGTLLTALFTIEEIQ